MNARWSWRLIVAAMAGLIAAGCETSPKPSEVRAELEPEQLVAAPQVRGVSSEAPLIADVATVSAAAQSELKEAGVTLVRASETAEGNWYLGRSLAGREVLVEVRPIRPGRTVLRVAVQGEDALARGLQQSLTQGTADRMRR